MPTLLELTAEIVSAHVSNMQMSSDEMLQELQKVHASLKALESGAPVEPAQPKQLSIKQAFKKDEVVCMICGKGGFKTLKRHLAQAHDLKPGQYRKQFNIPSSISLTAKNYSESRRQGALDRGVGDNLSKARAARTANVKGKKSSVTEEKVKAPVPAVKVKAAVPAIKTKAPVPAVKQKAAVPAKIQEPKPLSKPAKAPKKKK
jgi:predicted transcriptional regulator